ncbi:MFS transporter [Occallatibacter riparius]|uniref:MFS transporter n=1 Tax=Occallatibacter riparius TaxID=1002689 RepID=A0A9J7BQB6_9BACT|nr:MFS transporter [Occallatibacter riparius]UWZ83938.1 MFS transporter [Occallatibacter riparius]
MQQQTQEQQRWWLTRLDREARATLIATFAGWMLDGMDVMVYSFVLPALIVLWHMTKAQAGWLGTSALLVSSLGGWLAGLAADRWGRVRILQLTIVWFAVFTFLSGFTNSFEQLLVVRGLQGLGFGGEWAVGSVLIGERIRAEFRGRAVGTTQAGWAVGWAIAAVFYTIAFKLLPESYAWRAMFWVGLLPALLAIWIQRHVHEPEIFVRRPAVHPSHFLRIFSAPMVRTTLLASAVALGAQGGYYAVNTFLPLYLRARGLGVISTGAYLLIVIAGSFAGYLTSAHLTDRIGRRASLIVFAAGSFAAIAIYMVMPLGNAATLVLGFPLGFFPSGSFSPMGSFFTELFPTSLRGSGQGFSYNFGRAVGALFPTLVGYFSARMALGTAIAWFAGAAYAVMVAAVLMLPETRYRELAEIETVP